MSRASVWFHFNHQQRIHLGNLSEVHKKQWFYLLVKRLKMEIPDNTYHSIRIEAFAILWIELLIGCGKADTNRIAFNTKCGNCFFIQYYG